MMYWVDGDELLEDGVCASPGPPYYYFAEDEVSLFQYFFVLRMIGFFFRI